MKFFFHSKLSYGCEYLCKSILAVLFLFYSKKYNVQLITNFALATAKAEVNILFPFAVELCKDTKYNLWECRRVLQTVVKYMT